MRLILALTLALAISPVARGDANHAKKAASQAAEEEYAFGRAGDSKKATRMVRIGMADTMRFSPAELNIRRGETVRFLVRNTGKLEHEMVIGTLKELKEHAEAMRKHPGMEMEHDEPFAAHVPPGKSRILVWQFTKPGEFHFGCLEPGHFEAGMVGKVTVTP